MPGHVESGAAARTEAAPAPRRLGSLTLRVLSGIVLVPFLLGVAYVGDLLTPGAPGGIVYGLLICAATAMAAFEVRGMLRQGGYAPQSAILLGLATALPLDA